MSNPVAEQESTCAVLYSGGSDSTLTAALAAQRHQRIHLLTFSRFGIFAVDNSRQNVQRLAARYGADRFEHEIIGVDRLFRRISYDRYLRTLWRHGLFVLSTCGLCKLAMHLRALIYCAERGITTLYDGANQAMDVYPAQMRPIIEVFQQMYRRFGISYGTPVYDYDGPSEMMARPEAQPEEAAAQNRTDRKLYDLGITDAPLVKGTATDHAMQPRCFQFILFRIFVHWVYLPSRSYEDYVARTVALYTEKVDRFSRLVERHLDDPGNSPLARDLRP